MLATMEINSYLNTSYTVEDVAAMDPLFIVMMRALQRGLNPPKVEG